MHILSIHTFPIFFRKAIALLSFGFVTRADLSNFATKDSNTSSPTAPLPFSSSSCCSGVYTKRLELILLGSIDLDGVQSNAKDDRDCNITELRRRITCPPPILIIFVDIRLEDLGVQVARLETGTHLYVRLRSVEKKSSSQFLIKVCIQHCLS